jgi:DNA polymerase III subunit delta'
MAEAKTEQTLVIKPRVFPWQTQAIEQLRQAWSAQRLPHALLLQGAEGLGKKGLAAWIAAAVLCDRSRGAQLDRCGECASCKLIDSGSHPDLLWVRPEEDKQQISIDQLRAASERLSKTSYREGYKVAIIEPAHQMTPNAANSLLKTLEEPAGDALLILISSRPSSLLPTVRSRCQKLSLAGPNEAESLAWVDREAGREVARDVLEFAGRAPLRALEQADGAFEALSEHMVKTLGAVLVGRADVTQIAAEWADERLIDRLNWLDLWLQSLARGALAGSDEFITFPSRPVHLPSLPHALNISGVYSLVDRARALKAQLARTALQRELAVASWLFALLDLLAPATAQNPRGASSNRSR